MTYDAREVANFILDYGDSLGRPVTKIAIQKIIYFAHGWHLAGQNRPLISQKFEAWEYGPVIRVVYDCFKSENRNQILSRARKFDPFTNQWVVVDDTIREPDRSFLEHVFKAYGHYHAFDLVEMTHEPGSPWHRIWEAEKNRVHVGMEIPNDEIRSHFIAKSKTMLADSRFPVDKSATYKPST
jgi:uncharacterized phage-associated protein